MIKEIIDPEPPGYLYQAVATDLTRRIRSGELAPNTPLPAEVDLARRYGVSLGTARHATRLLRERGLVVTIRSKGTYVVKRDEKPPICLWGAPG
ncbi:MAG TPA: winged helix-turn-helix domain-containing protein [Amycolatopsis sp.]|uniref:winged helix-turn-helix domain-containing protein n=1 Tax=Amycolatopsis sp. TaxID=37632 RepID=UPI002B460E68|nr:winged helix-turn-helix domain-containing protein [Amycolatopsis sp.]HKS44340.1 winged helix-turn-helix domain-containing protein [Amycolatopsis sp.]